MPAKVLLKSDFDNELKESTISLGNVIKRFNMEFAKPTVWNAKQVADLREIQFTLQHLAVALTYLAAHVRDD